MVLKKVRELGHDLRQVRKPGSFARNAAFAFSGTALVTASQLILTPLVARIYGPEVYGAYGIFLGLCTSLSLVADMGFTQAYVLPREEGRFLDLVRGNLILLAAVFVLLIPIGALYGPIYDVLPGWKGIGPWLLLLPVGMATQFLPILFTQWLVRAKAFGRSSSIGGSTNVALRLFNLGYGWAAKAPAHGLILGEMLVRGISLGVYWRALRSFGVGRILHDWDLRRIRTAWHEYRNYPGYVFPERWVALLGLQLPIYYLSSDPVVVGQFGMASGLLLLPLRLFGFSLGVVFNQKAAETWQTAPEELARITKRFYYRLLLIGLVPFAGIAVFGDVVFEVFLGARWRVSGVFAAWLGGFFFYRLLSEPIINLFNVRRRERRMLVFQAVLLVARIVGLAAGWYWRGSAMDALLAYALASTLGYMWLTADLLRLAGVHWRTPLVRATLAIGMVIALMMLLRSVLLHSWFPYA